MHSLDRVRGWYAREYTAFFHERQAVCPLRPLRRWLPGHGGSHGLQDDPRLQPGELRHLKANSLQRPSLWPLPSDPQAHILHRCQRSSLHGCSGLPAGITLPAACLSNR